MEIYKLLKNKNINDIKEYLKNKFNVIYIPESNLWYKNILYAFKINILNSLNNEYYKLKMEDLNVEVYELKNDAKSMIYYK